jgi:hypothetical protein
MSIRGYLDYYCPIRLRTVAERFPLSWRERMVKAFGKLNDYTYGLWLERVLQLTDAERGGLSPDATDAEICTAADVTARDFARRIGQWRAAAIGHAHDAVRLEHRHERVEGRDQWSAERVETPHRREVIKAMHDGWPDAFAALCARDLLDERRMVEFYPRADKRKTTAGVLRRLCCAKFWRRVLRRLHARTVEACAIGIGVVGRHADLYVSNGGVRRRIGQNARNAAGMESVTAANDMGQAFSLAELAALGTSNKAIRRVELMTRIAGFELIAKGMPGHQGWMVTMTCPSRFHKMTTKRDGRVVPNPRYDGSTPADGQAWLTGQWAKCRAMAKRIGLEWYGFRIAEPQHDGTPHWHCLLFVPGSVDGVDSDVLLHALVRAYFLDADNPHEPGAQQHRVDFEWINPAKGSATGYVIKYVSKNIDGHGVGLDLFGNDAITSSARVEAWASTWRIRQFQQLGGAPVGVWRELRRIHPDNVSEHAPEPLRVSVSAVNAKGEPGVQAIAWKRYTMAQGGIGAPREAMPLRVMKRDEDGQTSYGEPKVKRTCGLSAVGRHFFRNHIHRMMPDHPPFERQTFAQTESERAPWVVVHCPRSEAVAYAAQVFQRIGAAGAPRIHVNNCTQRDLSRQSEFAPVREYRPRLRRFQGTGGGSTTNGVPPWTKPPPTPAPRQPIPSN